MEESDRPDTGRIKLNVGFTVDEALETLIPDEGWQYTAMGCILASCVSAAMGYGACTRLQASPYAG